MRKWAYLVVIAGAFAFVSCKKCQTCTTQVTQTYSGGTPQSSSTSEEYCGDDYDNAPAESAVTQSTGGYEQTVVITCTDN